MIVSTANRLLKKVGWEITHWPRAVNEAETVGHHIDFLLHRFEIQCVIDVGANQGQYGDLLRKLGYKGKIISFEPGSESFNKLRAATETDEMWIARKCALGNENGIRLLNMPQDKEFASFLSPTDFSIKRFPKSQPTKQEEVRITRLDDILPDCLTTNPSRIYLKLDTQGYDLEVLAGATETLQETPVLQSEISVKPIYQAMPNYLESLNFIQNLGYGLTAVFPVSKDKVGQLVELDAFFSRNGSLGR